MEKWQQYLKDIHSQIVRAEQEEQAQQNLARRARTAFETASTALATTVPLNDLNSFIDSLENKDGTGNK